MWKGRRGDEGVYRWLNSERGTLFNGCFRKEVSDEVCIVEDVGVLFGKECVDDGCNLFTGLIGDYFFKLLLLENEGILQT